MRAGKESSSWYNVSAPKGELGTPPFVYCFAEFEEHIDKAFIIIF